MNEIKLGDKVKDSVTGLEGRVTCLAEYIDGLKRAGIEYINSEKNLKHEWFNIERLEKCEPNSANTGLPK